MSRLNIVFTDYIHARKLQISRYDNDLSRIYLDGILSILSRHIVPCIEFTAKVHLSGGSSTHRTSHRRAISKFQLSTLTLRINFIGRIVPSYAHS
jgi:hypothetical protein